MTGSGGRDWFGGERIERLSVGVHTSAHPDAPNSLSEQPANENAERAYSKLRSRGNKTTRVN